MWLGPLVCDELMPSEFCVVHSWQSNLTLSHFWGVILMALLEVKLTRDWSLDKSIEHRAKLPRVLLVMQINLNFVWKSERSNFDSVLDVSAWMCQFDLNYGFAIFFIEMLPWVNWSGNTFDYHSAINYKIFNVFWHIQHLFNAFNALKVWKTFFYYTCSLVTSTNGLQILAGLRHSSISSLFFPFSYSVFIFCL